MPGLTLNTGAAAAAPSARPAGSAPPHARSGAILPPAPPAAAAAAAAAQSSQPQYHHNQRPQQTPIPPPPQPHPQPQQYPQQQPPPPVSPITPPLKPTTSTSTTGRTASFPPRPSLTHSSQVSHNSSAETAAETTIPEPQLEQLEPLDFDTNPDVLALRSAIAVLQNQRRRATADMVSLDRARAAALAEPGAFLQDLVGGRVGVAGDGSGGGLFGGGGDIDGDSDSDSDSADSTSGSSESDGGEEGPEERPDDAEMGDVPPLGQGQGQEQGQRAPPPPPPPPQEEGGATARRRSKKTKSPSGGGGSGDAASGASRRLPQKRPWSTLPATQNVVRCPPINWAQYAVVGESLDKLHGEQQAQPAQGQPAVLTADGRFEFTGASGNGGGAGGGGEGTGAGAGAGRQETYLGVAAPYSPLRDKLPEKKPRGSKR